MDLISIFSLTILLANGLLKPQNVEATDRAIEFPQYQNLTQGQNRDYYYHGNIYLIKDTDSNGDLIRCEFIEAMTDYEVIEVKIAVRQYFASNGKLTVYIRDLDLTEMLQLIYDCNQLNTIGLRRFRRNPFLVFEYLKLGENWCGKRNEAKYFHDLIMNSDADRCCRAHELCPVKIRGEGIFRSGRRHYFPYTFAHCFCELIFKDCLEKSTTDDIDIPGNIIKVSNHTTFHPESICFLNRTGVNGQSAEMESVLTNEIISTYRYYNGSIEHLVPTSLHKSASSQGSQISRFVFHENTYSRMYIFTIAIFATFQFPAYIYSPNMK